MGKIFELFSKLKNLPVLTCAIPGIRGDHNDLVSTCSGTKGYPTSFIRSKCRKASKALGSSDVSFLPKMGKYRGDYSFSM